MLHELARSAHLLKAYIQPTAMIHVRFCACYPQLKDISNNSPQKAFDKYQQLMKFFSESSTHAHFGLKLFITKRFRSLGILMPNSLRNWEQLPSQKGILIGKIHTGKIHAQETLFWLAPRTYAMNYELIRTFQKTWISDHSEPPPLPPSDALYIQQIASNSLSGRS